MTPFKQLWFRQPIYLLHIVKINVPFFINQIPIWVIFLLRPFCFAPLLCWYFFLLSHEHGYTICGSRLRSSFEQHIFQKQSGRAAEKRSFFSASSRRGPHEQIRPPVCYGCAVCGILMLPVCKMWQAGVLGGSAPAQWLTSGKSGTRVYSFPMLAKNTAPCKFTAAQLVDPQVPRKSGTPSFEVNPKV